MVERARGVFGEGGEWLACSGGGRVIARIFVFNVFLRLLQELIQLLRASQRYSVAKFSRKLELLLVTTEQKIDLPRQFLDSNGVEHATKQLSQFRDEGVHSMLLLSTLMAHASDNADRTEIAKQFVQYGGVVSLAEMCLHTFYANETGRRAVTSMIASVGLAFLLVACVC